MTEVLHLSGQVIRYDPAIVPQITPEIFDPQWLCTHGHLTGSAPGRGQAQFLHIAGRDLVLRPYRRGGLISRINTRFYLRLGARRSRAFREYDLLDWMRGKGLFVPRPVAAHYMPAGPVYRAALITERIAGARPLADLLRDTGLPFALWNKIGRAVAEMHALGVDHTDLNCRNILLDAQQQVWLIDFDKCGRRNEGPWAAGNLARLERSLDKERARHPDLNWSHEDRAALAVGYKA